MKKFTDSPELDLAVAILVRAIEDCKIKRKLLLKGKDWIQEIDNDPEYWLFESELIPYPSFISVCGVLNLEVELMRMAIMDLLAQYNVPVKTSATKWIKEVVQDSGMILRSKLACFVWNRYRISIGGLEICLKSLTKNIVGERRYNAETKRWGFYYLWIEGKGNE